MMNTFLAVISAIALVIFVPKLFQSKSKNRNNPRFDEVTESYEQYKNSKTQSDKLLKNKKSRVSASQFDSLNAKSYLSSNSQTNNEMNDIQEDNKQAQSKINKESSLNKINTKTDALKFLKSVRLANPNDIRSAYPKSTADVINRLAGVYTGELTWEESPNHPVQLTIEYLPQSSDGLIQGKFSAELTFRGVNIENRKFTPILATLPGKENSMEATVLSLSNKRYLQLYYVSNLDQWIGNYYMQNPLSDNLQYVGSTLVKRTNAAN